MSEMEHEAQSGGPQYQELVKQLDHPKTRRAARQQLVAAGAVDALLECFDSGNESVIWAAVESLGELRAKEAIGPLANLLQRGTLVVDVCEALTLITGQDFGADAKKWQKWADGAATAEPSNFDAADCVRRTADLLGVEPIGAGASYQLKLSLPEGRAQKVAVFFNRRDDRGEPLVVVYSECGPASPKYYEAVLRKNLAIPAGAFAIRDIDEKPNFVMVDAMLVASVTPSVLAKKIEHIAARADMVEKSITKEDRR